MLLRAQCKRTFRICYSNYINRTENFISSNPKNFWKFVNQNRKESGLPSSMTDGYTFAESGQDIMNLFAKHFQSVYRPASLLNGSQHSTDDNMLMSNVTLYKNKVLLVLRSIDCNKGAGPDMLPPMLLAKCADVLVTPILSLFNQSLTTGIFPEAWKRSFITPIFKSGHRNNVLNYRPISIISSMPKILDCLIADKLSTAVSNLIIPEKHGFRSRKSTLSNLIIYEQFLFDALSNNLHGLFKGIRQSKPCYID